MISAGWLAEILTIKNMGYRMIRLTTARYRYKGRGCNSFLSIGVPFPLHDVQIGEHKEENDAREYRPAGCGQVVVLPGILVVRKGRNQRCGRSASQDKGQFEDAKGVNGPEDKGNGDIWLHQRQGDGKKFVYWRRTVDLRRLVHAMGYRFQAGDEQQDH